MVLYPNAKINLGLRIIEKRSDGFHNLETFFIPIDLCDILEFVPQADGPTRMEITGIALDSDPMDNLVVKAWSLMHEAYGVPALNIHLHKLIPVGAGLGGGSADAAFMLSGINEFFHCGCSLKELEGFAASIGSDCAFFIRNKSALGTGRGEILQILDLDMSGYEILLVNPGIHISSKEAYSGVSPRKPSDRLADLLRLPVSEWQGLVGNDFEKSVFTQYPAIRDLKEKILAMGADYASMSGSGSSVYGLFRRGLLETLQPDFGSWFWFKGRIL